jgi:hypothetical protein
MVWAYWLLLGMVWASHIPSPAVYKPLLHNPPKKGSISISISISISKYTLPSERLCLSIMRFLWRGFINYTLPLEVGPRCCDGGTPGPPTTPTWPSCRGTHRAGGFHQCVVRVRERSADRPCLCSAVCSNPPGRGRGKKRRRWFGLLRLPVLGAPPPP